MRLFGTHRVDSAGRSPRAALRLLVLSAALLGTACNSTGPRAIRDARFPYNEALVQTTNEQLLLNLVRLRYRDTPYFLEVTSLTTQYELSGTLAAGVTLVEGGDGDASIGSGVDVSETPTVSYVPLQGEDFVKQLLRRVPLDDVMLLPQAGWSVERVMRLTVDQFAGVRNAPTTTGPTPDRAPDYEAFNCLAATLRSLQRENRLQLHVEPMAPSDGKDGETADDEFRYTLEILHGPPPETAATCAPEVVDRVTALLEPGAVWRIRHPWEGADDGVQVTTRSLMGTLHYLSQAVEVPAEHLAAGLATPTGPRTVGCTQPAPPGAATGATAAGAPTADRVPASSAGSSDRADRADWAQDLYQDLFRVHCSPERPRGAFVSVRYRGHWFYIADHDLQSKSTWGLLAQLVSLQAGAEARGLVPALTLSAGR